MASDDPYKEIHNKLMEILQSLMETGDWSASLFLRAAQKKIQVLYEEASILSTQLEDKARSSRDQQQKIRIQQGYTNVYVSIYQSDPYNLARWENTLKSIKEYSINRPIYGSEAHIEEAIRSKGSINEGYVIIYVKEVDIIEPYPGKIIEDRWGHELLTLRDNSLKPANILEFVHQGQRYDFIDGKLLSKP